VLDTHAGEARIRAQGTCLGDGESGSHRSESVDARHIGARESVESNPRQDVAELGSSQILNQEHVPRRVRHTSEELHGLGSVEVVEK
jgi:hypothetical protein